MDTFLTAQRIREIYLKLYEFFGFKYENIGVKIVNSIGNVFEYDIVFNEPDDNIDHSPNEYKIVIPYNQRTFDLIEKYEFISLNSYVRALIELLVFIMQDKNEVRCVCENGYEMDCPIYPDKENLYEFLIDNFKKYNSHNLPKSQITISYGLDTKITINNHDNWLYYLLKLSLHKDLTHDGEIEYVRLPKQAERPKNAPKFHYYAIYNLYLLLKDVIGSKKEYPADFCKFILDFCQLCEIELIGRQLEVLGIKDLIKGARKQYKDMPIPYSLVR